MAEITNANFCIANIPAITRVQECSRLETGVGPSMASGNQRKVQEEMDFNVAARKMKSISISESEKPTSEKLKKDSEETSKK